MICKIFPELSLVGFPRLGQSERMILPMRQLDPGKEGGGIIDIGERGGTVLSGGNGSKDGKH